MTNEHSFHNSQTIVSMVADQTTYINLNVGLQTEKPVLSGNIFLKMKTEVPLIFILCEGQCHYVTNKIYPHVRETNTHAANHIQY